MKKRLFLTSAVMAGVLSVALTTGTFAWYKASNGISISGGSATASQVTITANAPEVGDVSGLMNISCELVDASLYVPDPENAPTVKAQKELVLAAIEGGSFVTKYTNSATGASYPRSITAASQAYYLVYEVKADFDSANTSDETWAALLATYQGKTYNITVTAHTGSTAALHIWTQASANVASTGLTEGSNTGLSKAFYDSTNEVYNFIANGEAVVMGYIVVYVDGNHSSVANLDTTANNYVAPSFQLDLTGDFSD